MKQKIIELLEPDIKIALEELFKPWGEIKFGIPEGLDPILEKETK